MIFLLENTRAQAPFFFIYKLVTWPLENNGCGCSKRTSNLPRRVCESKRSLKGTSYRGQDALGFREISPKSLSLAGLTWLKQACYQGSIKRADDAIGFRESLNSVTRTPRCVTICSFACVYSREVWRKILGSFDLGSRPLISWDSATSWLLARQGKSGDAVALRLIWTQPIYAILDGNESKGIQQYLF